MAINEEKNANASCKILTIRILLNGQCTKGGHAMGWSKKKTAGAAAAVMVLGIVMFVPRNKDTDYREKYGGVDLLSEVDGIGRDNTYTQYFAEHTDSGKAKKDIPLSVTDYASGRGVEVLPQYEGEKEVLRTEENSFVEWAVEVDEPGYYQVLMEYYPVENRGVDIERSFQINGEVPFLGAEALTFSRLWMDKTEVKKDNRGNDIRPTQVEAPQWTSGWFRDDMGYQAEPYQFWLEKGTNYLALEAVNEPVVIKSLTLKAVNPNPSYKEYQINQPEVSASNTGKTYSCIIQGEDSVLRSSPSLYATYDRSSAITQPYSASKICLNMGGGNSWRVPGQWIEWKFTVPEDGYYHITVKGRQNYTRGFVSNRSLYLDGKVPFREVETIGFKYSNNWEFVTLSDEAGVPYQFYLDKGEHSIRMEVTLGELGAILTDLESNVYRLNEMYRKILVLTGTTPDQFRDYKIETVYPEVIKGMDLESKRLYKAVDDIVAYSGQKASQVASAQTLATQLEKFVKRPDKIPVTLTNFKENISSLGTSILSMSEAPLDIDYIAVTGTDAPVPVEKETFMKKAAHEIRSFGVSFFEDYDSLGDVYDKDEAVEVWILSGRDQSTILKSMIDDSFTPESGIKVNVRLVEAGTLLNAVIAGTGPDVVLSVAAGEPVNYALRHAAEDLTQFEDCDEVLKAYYPSAYEPYKFQDGLYALPETQTYNVMFYREDIMEDLGLEVPQTWEELIYMLPTIQQNNMNVAIPSTQNTAGSDLSAFFALLYQNGGSMYNGEKDKAMADSEAGVQAFETYTRFYTHYKLPKQYDFVNRFRSGEIPLGIQNYGTFNTLVVFAPEIRGLWDFTLIPGIEMEDGTINRACQGTGVCTMMLKQEDEAKKQLCWEFMRWWADADTQVRFGREMESVMGSSARYATANRDAFEQLAWSSEQMERLKEQWEYTFGIPEVAGGYYTGRHLTNASRKVINDNDDPRETLLDYTRTINEEMEKKRIEFGLDSGERKQQGGEE